MAVYFLLAPHSMCVKIGYTNGDTRERVAKIQTGSPEPLLFLTWDDGGREKEEFYHGEFADCRLRGEWFRLTPRLRAFLHSLTCTQVSLLLDLVPDFDAERWNCNPDHSERDLRRLWNLATIEEAHGDTVGDPIEGGYADGTR